jgi:transposase-like protein
MGNPAGVKRDFKALERRRLQAARLLSQGLPEAEVARRVGVHRQSVNRWQRQFAESGSSALRRAGRAGRKPQLQASDLRRIDAGLRPAPSPGICDRFVKINRSKSACTKIWRKRSIIKQFGRLIST